MRSIWIVRSINHSNQELCISRSVIVISVILPFDVDRNTMESSFNKCACDWLIIGGKYCVMNL